VLWLALPTLKFHVGVGWRRLTPVGTGVSQEEGATRTKEVPAREGGSEGRLCRSTTHKFDCLGLSGLARGLEARAMPGWGSRYSRMSVSTLRGSLGRVHISGIGGIWYVLVPRGG